MQTSSRTAVPGVVQSVDSAKTMIQTIPIETKKAENLCYGLFPIIQIYLAKRMGPNTIH